MTDTYTYTNTLNHIHKGGRKCGDNSDLCVSTSVALERAVLASLPSAVQS